MIRKFVLKHERFFYRLLEILPGFFSWNVILFPYWGIFVIPNAVAYFILSYNIYWFYQSFQIAVTGIIAHFRVQASMNFDWLGDLKNFPDWEKVNHMVIIPTYKEPQYILERTIDSLLAQTLPKKQLSVVIAQEDRAPFEDKVTKMKNLQDKYGKQFGNFLVTLHKLAAGEVIGKASNERDAAICSKKELVDKKGMNIYYLTVTSCDADHVFHRNHFASLTFKFLDDHSRPKYSGICICSLTTSAARQAY